MFTSVDKALVGVVMGIAFIGNSVFGVDFGFDEGVVSTVIGGLTPLLVWLIPNK